MSDKMADPTPIIYALQREFDLPDNVATAANRLFEQYSDGTQIQTQERYLEQTAGACLFLAAKIHGEAPLPSEVADRVGEEKRLLLKTVHDIAGELRLNPNTITDPVQYVDLICDELGFGELVQRQAQLNIEHAKEAEILSGKAPRGIAAAAVYLGARLHRKDITQDEISKVIDVSNVTIRNRYQEQAELEPPTYLADVKPTYFDDDNDPDASDFLSVTWTGQNDPDNYVTPSKETLQTGVDTLDISDKESDVVARAQTLFRLAQDASQCDFASTDRVDEWVLAAVCVSAEQHDCDPTVGVKKTIAELGNITASQLEARCYKLRQAWDSEVDKSSSED